MISLGDEAHDRYFKNRYGQFHKNRHGVDIGNDRATQCGTLKADLCLGRCGDNNRRKIKTIKYNAILL